MSDDKYHEIFEMWRDKTLSAGFTITDFRMKYNFFVTRDNVCNLTRAIGAKMAYKSLVKQRHEELKLVQREMENIRWV